MKRFGITALLVTLLAALPLAQAAPASTVVGEWDMTTVSPVGENTNTVEFRKEGTAVKAFAKGPQGELAYDSTQVDGSKVTLVLTIARHHLHRKALAK